MRKILFRGKHKDNDRWIYWNVFGRITTSNGKGSKFTVERGGGVSYYYHIDQILEKIDHATIGQYTGLTANGKKIFEGDILEFGDKIGYVNHGTGCFCVKYAKPDYLKRNNPAIDIVLHECPNEVEIIGNIHDNPELLEAADGK